MKKVITASQIRAADRYTIENEPISSIDLMERAAMAFVATFVTFVPSNLTVHVVCGTGNNGGDGLAVARLLKSQGYTVRVSFIALSKQLSLDCRGNLERLDLEVDKRSVIDDFSIKEDVIIDALFGSGLNRPVTGFGGEVITIINQSSAKVVSIDMPSGLFADTIDLSGAIVQADLTITFQRPKLSFLLPESGFYVREYVMVGIGLDEKFIQSRSSGYFVLEQVDIARLMPKRGKFQHKADFGRVQVFSGSLGKMGAAFLCGKAVLKAGAGLLTVHIPACGYEVIQANLPEAMVTVDKHKNEIGAGEYLHHTNAICVGPGIGTSEVTIAWFRLFLSQRDEPLVLDADALNIIAMHPELMDDIPEHSILTPHVGEFHRLFGSCANGLERIEKMKKVASDRRLVIIFKGAHTAIALPSGDIVFNTTGNSGMATAGSGDVLSGIIAGFLSQGMESGDAALAAVYLHGHAGDLAAKRVGKMSLMASDLLMELPEAIINVTQTSFI